MAVSASALVLIADVGGAFPKFTVLTTGVLTKSHYVNKVKQPKSLLFIRGGAAEVAVYASSIDKTKAFRTALLISAVEVDDIKYNAPLYYITATLLPKDKST